MTVRGRRQRYGLGLAATITALLVIACGGGPSAPPISAGPGDVVVEADKLAFLPTTLTAPADAPITIILRNHERSVMHNVEIRRDGTTVYKGELITGPADARYEVGTLAAGTYDFLCTVHPTMQGMIEIR